MEVLLDEIEESPARPRPSAGNSSVDALLSDLEAETHDAVRPSPAGAKGAWPEQPPPAQRRSGAPPPLPSTPPSASAAAPPPPPPRELPQRKETARGIPAPPGAPPPPRARPASIPPPLAGRARASGRPAPPTPSDPGTTSSPAAAKAPHSSKPARAITEDDATEARAIIEAWEKELAATTDSLRQARLHYEIGRLAEERLADLRRAAAHYQEALTRSPTHVPTIRATRRALLARKNFQLALPLFDSEARVTRDPAEKAAVHFAKGRLLEDVLGQRGEARREYAIASELDRGDPSLLKALEQCDTDASQWSELGRTYERLANAVASDPRHRAALIVQRARLLETREKEIDAAIELYETALRLDPEASGALEALKRLHHRERRHRDLISVLEREAARSTDAGVRAMALYRIGRLHGERLGNRDEATSALERAAKEAPDEPLVLDELSRLYELGERWAELAQVLDKLAASAKEGVDRASLLLRIAQLREERLEDDEGALRACEAALAMGPTHVPTLQALGKLYAKRDDWEALVRMHLGEADRADEPKRRAAAHARIAEILETRLSRPDAACEHHTRALTLVAGYPPSFKALTRLHAQAGRWRQLVELYSRAVDETTDKDRAVTYLLKIGAVYEDSLGEHAQAAHAYRRVLTLDPRHLGAIHALQRATERAARWTELVEALELEAEHTRDQKQIVALLHRAGEVLDDLVGDREGAIARFERVLGIDPTYLPALTSLGRVYHRKGSWEDLLELYKRELELTPRGPDAVALLVKMGELAGERIGREDEAIANYRRAVEIDPTNRIALGALAQMLRERRDWLELVKVLEMELSGLTDPGARARAAFRLGEVYEERLAEPERAMAAYEQSRDAEAGYRPALDGLSRLRAEQGAYRKLVDEFEREAANTPDPKLGVAALVRAGELWAEQLNEPRRACAAYEKALEREPGHLGALLALESLYRRLANFEALAKTLALQARTLADPLARVAALRELARIQEARLGAEPAELRTTFEAILAFAPDDAGALAALERIGLATGARDLLARVDARYAQNTSDPLMRAAYRTRLAESLELSADPEALSAFRAALEDDPENLAAARGMSRIAEQTNDPEAAAEAARREARIVKDPEQSSALLVRAGRISEEKLADSDAALADYERALELWPENVTAAARLLELFLAAGRGAEAADRLARAASSAKSPERAADVWLEVARLRADLLDNLAGAIGALNRVLRTLPNHVPTLRRLAELYERDEQWTEAANLLGRVVQLAPDREMLKDAHLRLAALWDARLGDSPRALVSLQAVLALEQENRDALARLAALHEREGDLDKAAETVARLVAASQGSQARASALVQLARIAKRRKHPEAARDALCEAVALEGPSGVGAAAFREAIRDRDGYAEYARALAEHIRRHTEGAQHGAAPKPAYIALAGVLGDSLGQHRESAEVLTAACRAYPHDVELDRARAERLIRMGAHADAARVLRRRIDEDPSRVDVWRDLSGALAGNPELAALVLAPLALLGELTKEEAARLNARPSMPARAAAGSFGPEVLRHVYGIDPAAPVMNVLAALPEAFSRLFPPDLEAYGLGSRDRVTQRSGHPVRVLSDRVATIFGVTSYELFLHRARGRGIAIELSDPVSLMVPAGIAEMPEASQVFLLARAMASLAMKVPVIEKLTPREVEVLVASAARANAPGFGSGLTSEDILDDQTRRIQKALSRKARRALEEATPRYVETAPIDFASWARGMHLGAARAALLVCDDLLSAADVLRRTERDLADLRGPALVAGSPLVGELMRFWASEQAIELRRHAGLAR